MSEMSSTNHGGSASGQVWMEARKALKLKLASVLSQEPDLCTSDLRREDCKQLKLLKINHFQEL